jgi:hypothetical protein
MSTEDDGTTIMNTLENLRQARMLRDESCRQLTYALATGARTLMQHFAHLLNESLRQASGTCL